MKKILIKIIVLSFIFFAWVSVSKAAVIGEQKPFFVDKSYDAQGRSVVTAILLEASEHAYFYVENDWWGKMSAMKDARDVIHNLAIEFDQNIYPKLTKVYGSPWEPGIDNDLKVYILISPIREDAGGYFNSADEYLRAQAPLSNEKEMVYLNSIYYNSARQKSFLAHEFQHLITFYQKEKLRGVPEETWLNEARSEYASTLVGYDKPLEGSNLDKRISDFFKNPSDSLIEWNSVTIDYGSVNLFMQYVVNRFGSDILSKIMQSPRVGKDSIDDALASLGSIETFIDVFVGWEISNYIDDCRIDNQKYCYGDSSLVARVKVAPSVTQGFLSYSLNSVNLSDAIESWSGHWYKFIGGNANLKISFKGGKETVFKVAYIIEGINGVNEVRFINLDSSGQGVGFVENFGSDTKSVVLVPISGGIIGGAEASDPFSIFSYQVNLVYGALSGTEGQIASSTIPSLANGSLIRTKGDYKVYVISNGFKRWIQSSEIFNFYPHLKWESVIEITPEQRDYYKDSWLARASGDTRVYEIDSNSAKHWLNMSAEQFSSSGRSWDSVFIINQAERDWYKNGAQMLE